MYFFFDTECSFNLQGAQIYVTNFKSNSFDRVMHVSIIKDTLK